MTYGDELTLTESQARPLRNGGFVTPDKAAAQRIAELVKENETLKEEKPASSNDEATSSGDSE